MFMFYNPKTNSWLQKNLPHSFGWCAKTFEDDSGLIHIIGGERMQQGHYTYNAEKDVWKQLEQRGLSGSSTASLSMTIRFSVSL